jgi:hypothetical protein
LEINWCGALIFGGLLLILGDWKYLIEINGISVIDDNCKTSAA